MIFRTKTRVPVLLEPIAFADIVINLFIFFFISFGLYATFDQEQKGLIPIQLPVGGQKVEADDTHPLIVEMNEQGQLFLGKEQVSLDRLDRSVERSLGKRRSKSVVVRPDRRLSLGQFVPVLDSLRASGAQSISVETERPKT